MREKQIERKLMLAVKSMEGIAPKLVCPALTGCPTASCFYRVVTSALWKSRLPVKGPGPSSWRDMDCSGASASRFMCWTTPVRLEGFLMKYEPHNYQTYAIDYIETHPIIRQSCLIWVLAKRASR
jgi:hypothetical protein